MRSLRVLVIFHPVNAATIKLLKVLFILHLRHHRRLKHTANNTSNMNAYPRLDVKVNDRERIRYKSHT